MVRRNAADCRFAKLQVLRLFFEHHEAAIVELDCAADSMQVDVQTTS